jgi:hypothetical protein
MIDFIFDDISFIIIIYCFILFSFFYFFLCFPSIPVVFSILSLAAASLPPLAPYQPFHMKRVECVFVEREKNLVSMKENAWDVGWGCIVMERELMECA